MAYSYIFSICVVKICSNYCRKWYNTSYPNHNRTDKTLYIHFPYSIHCALKMEDTIDINIYLFHIFLLNMCIYYEIPDFPIILVYDEPPVNTYQNSVLGLQYIRKSPLQLHLKHHFTRTIQKHVNSNK